MLTAADPMHNPETVRPEVLQGCPIDLKQLSKWQRELIQLLGIQDAFRLMTAFGGRPCYVPKTPEPDGKLSPVISKTALDALSNRHGGDFLLIPKADRIERLIRNHKIRESSKNGRSKRQLAADFGLTVRTVQSILKRSSRGKTNG